MEYAITVVAAVIALGLGLLVGGLSGRQKAETAARELEEKLEQESAKADARLEETTGVFQIVLNEHQSSQDALQDELEAKTGKVEELEAALEQSRDRIAELEAGRLRFRRFLDGQFKDRLERFIATWKKARLPSRVEELLAAKPPSKAATAQLTDLSSPLQDWMEQLGLGSAEAYFQLGLWQVQQGHLKEGLETFQQSSEKGMGFESWLAQGDIHWHQERPEKAAEAYRRCLRADGMPKRVFLRTARVATGKHRYKDTLAALDLLLKGSRKQPEEVYSLASLAARKLERYERAVEICEAGLKHHPGSTGLLADQILPLTHLERDEEAEELYLKATESDPESATPALAMGEARLFQHRLDSATEYLEDAVRLDPELAEGHFHLGLLANHQLRFKLALERFQRAIELQPDYAEAYYHMKDSYEGLQKFDEAIAALAQATRLNPDFM